MVHLPLGPKRYLSQWALSHPVSETLCYNVVLQNLDPVKFFECYQLLDCMLDVACVTICVWHSRILLSTSMFCDPNSCPMIMPCVWNLKFILSNYIMTKRLLFKQGY